MTMQVILESAAFACKAAGMDEATTLRQLKRVGYNCANVQIEQAVETVYAPTVWMDESVYYKPTTDLFVYYTAHRKSGELRQNNMVFKNCTPITTIDDIKNLERDIIKLYDYEDAKIMHWQRMESSQS